MEPIHVSVPHSTSTPSSTTHLAEGPFPTDFTPGLNELWSGILIFCQIRFNSPKEMDWKVEQ